jgi:hypothetical protein
MTLRDTESLAYDLTCDGTLDAVERDGLRAEKTAAVVVVYRLLSTHCEPVEVFDREELDRAGCDDDVRAARVVDYRAQARGKTPETPVEGV